MMAMMLAMMMIRLTCLVLSSESLGHKQVRTNPFSMGASVGSAICKRRAELQAIVEGLLPYGLREAELQQWRPHVSLLHVGSSRATAQQHAFDATTPQHALIPQHHSML